MQSLKLINCTSHMQKILMHAMYLIKTIFNHPIKYKLSKFSGYTNKSKYEV
jgi:hypothetical protein